MRYLITGGNGLLGTELQKHMDGVFLGTDELDVMDLKRVYDMMMKHRTGTILHLAAYTDVERAEVDRQAAWDFNVIGTQNFARASKFLGAKLVYLSTDYVFDGVSGSYEPWDAPNPFNYYGVTKLAGECVARSAIASLIIRTSFQPSVFPHSRVVDDLWTSADYVDVIAKKLVDILPYTGIYHLGTGRKLLKDLIHQRNPDVETIRREDIKDVRLPWDVSFGKVPHMDWEMG